MFAVVQNKFQQTNKTKINHINDNHIEFEVSLHFLGIWPTVCKGGGGGIYGTISHSDWTLYTLRYCAFIQGLDTLSYYTIYSLHKILQFDDELLNLSS